MAAPTPIFSVILPAFSVVTGGLTSAGFGAGSAFGGLASGGLTGSAFCLASSKFLNKISMLL